MPDNAGLMDDYEPFYPPSRWRDPVSYLKTLETIEETTQDTLAHGLPTSWMSVTKSGSTKNARGERTSA